MTDCGRRLSDGTYIRRTRIPLNDQQGSSITTCLLHTLCLGHLKSFITPLHHALSHLWIFPYTIPFLWPTLPFHILPLTILCLQISIHPSVLKNISSFKKVSFPTFPQMSFGGLGFFPNRASLLWHGFVTGCILH